MKTCRWFLRARRQFQLPSPTEIPRNLAQASQRQKLDDAADNGETPATSQQDGDIHVQRLHVPPQQSHTRKQNSQEEIPDDNVNLTPQTAPPKRIQLFKSYTKNLSVKTGRWRKKLATSLRSQTKDLRTWKAQERWKKELAISIALKTHVLPFLPLPSPPSPFFGDRVEKSRAGLDLVWEIAGQVGTGVEKSRAGLDLVWEIAGQVGTLVEKSRAGLDLVWEIAGQVGTLVEKSRAWLEPWWRNRGPGCDYQKRERSNGVPRVNSNFIFYPPG